MNTMTEECNTDRKLMPINRDSDCSLTKKASASDYEVEALKTAVDT